MRIFLIGFMGSGKTTIGKELSKDIDFKFLGIGTGQHISYLKLLINPLVWLVCAIFWNHHQFMAGKGLRP